MTFSFMIFFAQAATSWLVGPAGLSRFMTPFRMYSSGGLSAGLCPYFGFVSSSALTCSSRLISHGGTVLGIRNFLLEREKEGRGSIRV